MTCRSLLALGLFSLLIAGPAVGQTVPDSSRVSYSEEAAPNPQPVEGLLIHKYNKLVRLQVEERQFWKLGLNNFASIEDSQRLDYLRFGLHFIYERKLRTAWSVMGEVSPDFIRFRDARTRSLRNGFAVRSQVAGRYYYNLSRRIRKGKSASNFSANYVALVLGSGLGRQAQETPFFGYDYGGPFARLDGALLYGLQRRLGRYGFVDAALGLAFPLTDSPARTSSEPEGASIQLTGLFRIGLALGR